MQLTQCIAAITEDRFPTTKFGNLGFGLFLIEQDAGEQVVVMFCEITELQLTIAFRRAPLSQGQQSG